MRNLPAIDGLRAVAVVAVVAYHAGLPVPAGFVGVDIFFVISGYLITRLLHEEVQADGRIDFMAFYARRARRILPALLAVLVTTLALSALLLPDPEQVARSAAAAATFVANVLFEARTSDYWSPSTNTMPLLHLWSLSVEEQFYLVWPIVLILARRKPVVALASLAVLSLALAEWWMWRDPTMAFYQMPARAWELAAGGLVALVPMRIPRGCAWIGLAVVLVACFVPFGHFPGIGALPAVLGTALVIAGVQAGQSVAPLTLQPVVFTGLISYSLYLWHWPLLVLDRAVRAGEAPLAVRLALCVAAFVLAALSYRYIETPMRRARVSTRRTAEVGLLCTLVMSSGALAVSPIAAPAAPQLRCHPFRSGESAQMQRPACSGRGPKVVLWGDSFAHAWTPLALSVADRLGVPAVAFSTDACPALVGVTMPLRTADESSACRIRNDALVDYLRRNGADTVVIATRWQYYSQRPRAAAGFLASIPAIAPYVRSILIVGPTPEVLDDAPKCAALQVSCAVSRQAYLADAGPAWLIVRKMAGNPKVTIVDASTWLCDKGECPGVRDGRPLYSDRTHVTQETAQRFADDYLRHARLR